MAESDTLLEGRAAAFSVEIEGKCIQKIDEHRQQLKDGAKLRDTIFNETIQKMEDQIKRFSDEYEQKYVQA